MQLPYFSSRLSMIMRDNIYDRREPNHRSGKLNLNKLYKIKTGNTKVFTRLVEKTNKYYNIILILDASGSMGRNPKSDWNIASHLTADIFKATRNNNIECSIVLFGDNAKTVPKQNLHLQTFHKINKLRMDDIDTGSTDFISALYEAKKNINYKYDKEHNIVIFITDGDHNSGRYSILEKQIEKLEDNTLLFAIGINSTEVKDYFSEFAIVSNASQALQAILLYITNNIKREI